MPLTTQQAQSIMVNRYAIRVGKSDKDLDGDAYTLLDVDDLMEMLTWLDKQPDFDAHLYNTALFILKMPNVDSEHLLVITGFKTAAERYNCKNDKGIEKLAKGDKMTLHKGGGSAKGCKVVASASLKGVTAEKVVEWVLKNIK